MDSGTLIHIHYNEKLKMVNFFEKIFYVQVVQDACLTGVVLRCSQGVHFEPPDLNFFFFLYNIKKKKLFWTPAIQICTPSPWTRPFFQLSLSLFLSQWECAYSVLIYFLKRLFHWISVCGVIHGYDKDTKYVSCMDKLIRIYTFLTEREGL